MNQHRDSTKKNYYAVWKVFNEFIIKLDQKPKLWQDRLTLFVGYLVEQNRQSSTVRSYISAIKAVLKMNNIRIEEDQFLLSSLTQACRLKNDRLKTRLPIRKAMLSVVLRETRKYFLNEGQPYLASLYQTIFCTCYYGLLRISEVCAGSHPILVRDMHIAHNKRTFMLVLRTSKTHGLESPPQIVKISSSSKSKPDSKSWLSYNQSGTILVCLYNLHREYSRKRGGYTSDAEPFFVFPDKKTILPRQMSTSLKMMIKLSGFNETLYGSRSLRLGRTCDLYKLGLSVESIKKMGRWKSNVVFRYLKM